MKCFECGAAMKSAKLSRYHDKGTGLRHVYLKNVSVRTCSRCGEREIVIPNVEGLHRALAGKIIRRPGRLTPSEIRFLRKHMGWSGTAFARVMGVEKETVSRWENGRASMGETAERLLRLAVAHGKQVESYPLESLGAIERKAGAEPTYTARQRKDDWVLAQVD